MRTDSRHVLCVLATLLVGCEHDTTETMPGGDGGEVDGDEPPGFVLELPRVPWEGGPAYWSKFPKPAAAGWTASSFFPIAVWLQSANDAPQFRTLGINVQVGVNHDGANLTSIGASTGMFFIAQDEWTPSEIGANPNVVGWLASDECDMGYSGCTTNPIAQNQGYVDRLRALGDGRFVYSNYGKGAIGTFWNPQNMPALVQMVDAASDDLYFFTDPGPDGFTQSPHWPMGAEPRRAASYGWTMNRMWTFQQGAPLHPTWNVVEVGHPYSESYAPTITPDQMEGATWASIIREARGLLYFNHSFAGSCGSFNVLLECTAAMRARFTETTAKIHELAPVLNTQSYEWSAGSGVTTMLKFAGGSLYLFAQVDQVGSPGMKTLKLPGNLDGTVDVRFEGRTVPIAGGTLTDMFADTNVVHIYRLTP